MRFFGVASAVKAAVYVIWSGHEAAWEDILTGDWMLDLHAQLRHKIVGDSATPSERQVEALDCIDELFLQVTTTDGHRDLLVLRELIIDVDQMDLQEAWTWCALPPSIAWLGFLPRPHSRARHRLPLAIGPPALAPSAQPMGREW